MAPRDDDSFETRRRKREREDANENQQQSLKDARKKGKDAGFSGRRTEEDLAGDRSVEKLIELMKRAEPMIDQLNGLYNLYIAGVESRPPIERRKHLDQLMMTLQMMGKPTATHQFKFNSLNASYHTHRERWDRLMKDLESGKIKRVTGPKRG